MSDVLEQDPELFLESTFEDPYLENVVLPRQKYLSDRYKLYLSEDFSRYYEGMQFDYGDLEGAERDYERSLETWLRASKPDTWSNNDVDDSLDSTSLQLVRRINELKSDVAGLFGCELETDDEEDALIIARCCKSDFRDILKDNAGAGPEAVFSYVIGETVNTSVRLALRQAAVGVRQRRSEDRQAA